MRFQSSFTLKFLLKNFTLKYCVSLGKITVYAVDIRLFQKKSKPGGGLKIYLKAPPLKILDLSIYTKKFWGKKLLPLEILQI